MKKAMNEIYRERRGGGKGRRAGDQQTQERIAVRQKFDIVVEQGATLNLYCLDPPEINDADNDPDDSQ